MPRQTQARAPLGSGSVYPKGRDASPRRPRTFRRNVPTIIIKLTHYLAAALALLLAGATMTRGADAVAPSPLPVVAPYDVNNPPQGVFEDEWMELYISGQKVGYAHESYRRDGDHIFSESQEEFKIKRLSFVLSATSNLTSEETLDGVPLSFHSVTDMSDQPVVVDGHGDGKVFTITKTVGTFKDTQQVTFPEGALMGWGQERLSRLKGLKPGTEYSFYGYDPGNDAFTALKSNVTVGAQEKVPVRGQDVEASRVAIHLESKSGLGSVDTQTWVDPNFETVKIAVDMGGLSMEMIAATKAEAMGTFVAKDIFSASLLTINQTVPDNAQAVTFDLHRTDGQPLPLPPESLTEHGMQLPDGGVAITLRHAAYPAKSNPALGAGLPDAAAYLARNSFMDTSDPLLRSLADQAGGPPGTNPVAVAWQLRDFVADYINKKDLSVGFATASQAAKSREGDCTEHAVLLAALGRVRGLPTRTVSGLVYLPEYDGEKNVLGFHMWSQFYFNGQWMDFDSAVIDGKVPYWRLGLVASDLDEVSLSDFTLQLMRWMSQLKITVASVDLPGKK